MLKYLSLIIPFSFITSIALSQSFFYDDKYYDKDLLWEVGASAGLMNAVTDVGERKGSYLLPGYYDWSSTKLNYSLYFGVLYKSTFEGRLEFTKGNVAGNDANSNSAYVRSRNLSYKSHIYEAALTGAFHPLMLFNKEEFPTVSPYVIAGIGFFGFYPKALYEGNWVALRTLNTEGQQSEAYPAAEQYSIRALSIPVGLGLKYEYSAKFNVRMEGLFRYTSTDYLDDVSTVYVDRSIFNNNTQKILSHRYTELNPQENRTGQARGKVENKDKFFTLNLKIGYVIGRDKRPINYAPK